MSGPIPTEPGYYWARHYSNAAPEPVKVLSRFPGDLVVKTIGYDEVEPLRDYVWGPRIPEPKEQDND